MITPALRQSIIRLIKREVVPATGCTEPVAVALATARAAAMLSDRSTVTSIRCSLSPNIIKNAMGVGIPGTGMIGLPIAVALGALAGDASEGLDVLGGMTAEDIDRAKAWLENGEVVVDQAPAGCETLFIDVTVADGKNSARAVISGSHTRFILCQLNGKDTLKEEASQGAETAADDDEPQLTLKCVWDFAMETSVDDIRFILETRRLNKAAAEWALMDTYGHRVGRTLHSERQRRVMGDSLFSRILSHTAAACDARMGGAPVAVMSNSGSGNQGIAATMPVVIYAEENYADEEQTIRALVLSHLTSIYIKQSLGRLSALCGCVVATIGSGAGICYLMGGGYDQIEATVKNMAANLTGMICDGAKPSCALKLTSGVSTAVISAMVAMEGECVSALEGIVDDDVDRTVTNLTDIGREGMTQTDAMILHIMTAKKR